MARTTLKDVARAAGVSPTAASFVLNATPGQTIPDSTADRIRSAARELGYVPNAAARALREGVSRIVVLDPGELPAGRSLESFVTGLRAELERHDHVLVISPGGTAALAAGRLEPRAVIDLSRTYDDGAADDGGWIDGLAAHSRVQVAHLAERGHRRIAFGRPASDARDVIAAVRERVTTDAARSVGMTVSRLDLREPAQSAAALSHAMSHDGVTAVAALDDESAVRTLAAARDLGIAVPADLAVVGFDESSFAHAWRPRLTTVRIDAAGFGRRAARTALGLPGGEDSPAPATIVAGDSA